MVIVIVHGSADLFGIRITPLTVKYKLPSWKRSGGHVTSSMDYFRYLCGHVTNAVSMFVTAQPTHLSSCKYFSMSNKIFSTGPAQAPVLHRSVLLPSGVLPARGPAARHPRARRPRLHLAVAVLGLGPPPHGGDPGHQAGQQTTAGRVLGTPCIVRRRPERDTRTFIIRITPRHFHSHHHTITLTIVPLHYSLLC